jgi:hypothetical protein
MWLQEKITSKTGILKKAFPIWRYGNGSLIVRIPGKKTIKTVELGTPYDADSDSSNNRWPRHL